MGVCGASAVEAWSCDFSLETIKGLEETSWLERGDVYWVYGLPASEKILSLSFVAESIDFCDACAGTYGVIATLA